MISANSVAKLAKQNLALALTQVMIIQDPMTMSHCPSLVSIKLFLNL